MNVAVIVPLPGKQKYQKEYDAIVKAIEKNGDTVLSPEKAQIYEKVLAHDTKIRDTARSHYEFIRKSLIDSDALIVEVTYEDFKMGHEATLALIYHKPVLALSQNLDLSESIHHPDFYGVKYRPQELESTVKSFLKKIHKQNERTSSNQFPSTATKKKTIAVFGAVNADIYNRVRQIPKADEIALSDDFKISLGGKATNAAVALARLGNEVFFCGRVGHDTMASDLEAVMIHEGIKTDFLKQDSSRDTGTVTLAVDGGAKYSTIVHEAANIQVSSKDVDDIFKAVDEGKLKLDCVYLTLEPQQKIVEYIVKEAAKRKLLVFCDAAPYTRPLDVKLLPYIDFVAPNELETKAITGIEVSSSKNSLRAAKTLIDSGVRNVIITLGDKGSYFVSKQHSEYTKAIKVDAIDEAAAGDAFRANFVNSYIKGQDVTKALKQATLAGAYAVTRFGSYDSMPTSEELKKFLQTQGSKNQYSESKK